MSAFVIVLVLISSFIHAVRDLINKKSGDKLAFFWLYDLCAIIIYFPLFLYFLIKEFPTNPIGLYIAMGAGIIHCFYWIFLAKSLETGDLSHVYPIARAAPALVLILSVVILQEQVSFLGVVGILLVTLGIYILHLKSISSWNAVIEPITSITKNAATRYALLTLITVSLYSITDKVAVSFIYPVLYSYLLIVFAFIYYSLYFFRIKNWQAIKNEWKDYKVKAITNGILVLGGYLLILFSFTMGKVSYITGLRQISIVIAVLLGGHFLLEKNRKIRLFASLIIFAGALLISIAK